MLAEPRYFPVMLSKSRFNCGQRLPTGFSKTALGAQLSHNVDKGFKMGITKDKLLAAEKLAHVYQVLATRGMKGTYFYFLDEETRRYFEAALAD